MGLGDVWFTSDAPALPPPGHDFKVGDQIVRRAPEPIEVLTIKSIERRKAEFGGGFGFWLEFVEDAPDCWASFWQRASERLQNVEASIVHEEATLRNLYSE